jgi:regulator of replication initiation timing
MSIYDELTTEIFDWITQGQDPETIKKDLMKTVDEALRKAPKEKYKPDLVKVLRYYMKDAYGEKMAKAYSDKDYESMAEAIFKTIDETMDGMPTYAKTVLQLLEEAAKEVEAETKAKTENKATAQEDSDAKIIENFLKDLDKDLDKDKKKDRDNSAYTYADDFHIYFGI